MKRTKVATPVTPKAVPSTAPRPATASVDSDADYLTTLRMFLELVRAQARQSPHLEAYSALKEADQEDDSVLSMRAAAIWNDVVQADPSESIALHHLAIIHHGRAYQRHLRGDTLDDATFDHWQRGLTAWAKLIRDDAFWTSLRAGWEAHPGDLMATRLLRVDLGDFRKQIPFYLLGLNAAVVGERYMNDTASARRHMEIIINSEFAPEAVESIRSDVYARLVTDIRPLIARREFDEARRRVHAYLALDADYPAALTDALRACTAEGEYVMKTEQNYDRAESILARGRRWADHEALRRAGSRQSDAATALRNYYRAAGQIEFERAKKDCDRTDLAGALGHYDKARLLASQGIAFEHGGDRARGLHKWACSQGCSCAFETNDLASAQRLIEAGLEQDPEDVLLNALLAGLYVHQGKDAEFRTQLQKADQLNARTRDSNASSVLADLRGLADGGLAQNRAMKLINDAVRALERGASEEALGKIAEAERIDENVFYLHYLKCETLLRTGSRNGARMAFQRASQLMDRTVSPDLRRRMLELRTMFG